MQHGYKNAKNQIEWHELTPTDPDYFFAKKDVALQANYNTFYPVTEIFESYKSGVSTLRDHFVVSFTEQELRAKMDLFKSDVNNEDIKNHLNLKDTRDWKIREAREDFKTNDYTDYILRYTYRPFDTRLICYAPSLYDRGCSREDLMKNFYKPNLGLITRRNCRTKWHDVFISDSITDMNFLDARTYVFPLYIHDNDKIKQKISSYNTVEGESGKQANFTAGFVAFLESIYTGKSISPEDILGYIYAILNSPTYRYTYEEFLKMDFPRIPFSADYNIFTNLSALGTELINLHLMKTKLTTSTKFNISGSNIVRSVQYKDGIVYINESQYFEGIPEDVWTFYIGGYQVLDKWLKSRKTRELSSGEIEHFLQVVEIVKKTIDIMKEIDGVTNF